MWSLKVSFSSIITPNILLVVTCLMVLLLGLVLMVLFLWCCYIWCVFPTENNESKTSKSFCKFDSKSGRFVAVFHRL